MTDAELKRKKELDEKFRKMSKEASEEWAKQGSPRTAKKTIKKGKK